MIDGVDDLLPLSPSIEVAQVQLNSDLLAAAAGIVMMQLG